MKQLLQSLKTGELSLEEVPCPQAKENHTLVKTACSLISAGTERMLMNFGKAGIIGKVRQQPDKVKKVITKMRTDGIASTVSAVKSKLDQPIPLGYCNVGVIHEISSGCENFSKGDRVVTNGPHAEIVRVPKNLCVKIPGNVSYESASFAVLGAIALQGVRLAAPTLGESFAVIGLGLVGQLTVQLLIAQGCRVLGIDVDKNRCELAKTFGAEVFHLKSGADSVLFAESFSRQRGMDGVLITASTDSDTPIKQAANMCRQRGRIVLIGVTGLTLSRDDFYKKELSFQVSCSYGPGRYDKNYEEKGQDYPIGFVRWTEQRNIEAVLDMLSTGKLNVKPLITHRFKFDDVIAAYDLLDDPSALGVVLKYSINTDQIEHTVPLYSGIEKSPQPPFEKGGLGGILDPSSVTLACVGAGNFASRILLPLFKKHDAVLHTLVTDQGINGVIHGRKNKFLNASTDLKSTLKDNAINTVCIATPHHLHAQQVIAALNADKHVFVEKPLVISEEQLDSVIDVYQSLPKKSLLMVGFNRRFSPFIQQIKQLVDSLREPKNMIMTVNAGFIPKDHWIQDDKIGGGRLLGEACHFIDLLRFIARTSIEKATVCSMKTDRMLKNENITITLQFADGSQGTVHYFANGNAAYPKERLEVFCAGKVLQLDNFRKLKGFGFKHFKKQKTWRQEKGHSEAISAFVSAIEKGKMSPIPFVEIVEVMRVCLDLN